MIGTAYARAMATCLGLSALPVAAQESAAKPKYGHYYNRPGASPAEMTLALEDCGAIARGTRRTGAVAVGVGPAGLAAGLPTAGLLSAITQAAKVRDNIQNCMVIRGWRLYAMTQEQGQAWEKLPDGQREARLATLAGAEAPDQGELYRVWRNDYAEPRLWEKP